MFLKCHGESDIGRVRQVNEDQFLIADLAKSMKLLHTSLPHADHVRFFGHHHGTLLLVADGMGGHAGGQKASGVAVRTVVDYVLNMMPWFYRFQEPREDDLERDLKSVLEECQRKVFAAAAQPGGKAKMGTTLTMAYVLWPRLYVVHAGDSRCYLIRNGRVHQITHDHTIAQQMLDRGLLTPEQAEQSRWSHVLWNCIGGGSEDLNPDVYKAQLVEDDTLLLCSDGLSKYVDEQAIATILNETPDPESAVKRLIAAANDAGGSDNITVIVANGTHDVIAKTKTRECVQL